MNDKEEKAIERCNQLIKVEHANWIGISNQVAIETVLNLIQTQQEEIDELKGKIIDNINDLEEMQDNEYDGMVQDFIDTLKGILERKCEE